MQADRWFARALVAAAACAALFAPIPAWAQDAVFIHHSVGSNWLANSLHAALVAKPYVARRNDITYGTAMAPDAGRPASLGSVPGDSTNMNHWIRWFNDYLQHVKAHQAAGSYNRIVMFKSCYPISNVTGDGVEPGDPFSGTQTIANYKAVYRHPDGPGGAYSNGGYSYKPLEVVFAEHPDILFIPVTAPPLNYTGTTDANAHRARVFNVWLRTEWLAAYNARHPGLHNVAVFDLFDVLAYADTDPDHPNRLRAEYGGATGDSHPNATGSAAATHAFSVQLPGFLDRAFGRWANAGLPRHFDADHLADPAVYRPSAGTWFSLDSSTGNTSFQARGWGTESEGDVPVPADYDGDGIIDPTVVRASAGTWFVLESSTGYANWSWFGWGSATDLRVPADYDGDGKADGAVYRPSSGTWYVRPSGGGAQWSVVFGGEDGDVPLTGDLDGDGVSDPAIYRPASGTWFWLTSSSGFKAWDYRGWGVEAQGDRPAPGDYDGDGKTDLCVFRPATGTWFVLESHAAWTTWHWFGWGEAADTLAPADYDGDGKTDAAIYRPATGQWFVRPSGGAAQWSVTFGQAGDVPIK